MLMVAGTACATRTDDLREGNDAEPPDTNGDALAWEPCGPRAECTWFDVPVDYDDPTTGTLTLSVAMVPASGDRIGALVVNPGGPGATASDFAVGLARSLPADITDRFDIVGLDPRGTEASAIDCDRDIAELYTVDHTPDSVGDRRALLAVSQDYVQSCDEEAGDLLPYLGTRNVARDIDALREALGDEQISYLGYSYGTAIGQVYADMFPDRVRAMLLDGLVELGVSGPDQARVQAGGFERALASFAEDCNPTDGCPLAPDAIRAIGELIDRVETAPIPATPRDLGPGELKPALALPLYTPPGWPDLAQGVAEALDGDGSLMVALADEYLSLANFDLYFAVSCLDFDWPAEPEQLLAQGADAAREAPHFGEATINDYIRCSMWPVESEPLPEITAPGAPPILVVSTTNDPATPHEAGVNVAERLQSGVLLTHDGEGHGVVGLGVACVDDAVIAYLVGLDPPDDGTTCRG